MHYMMNAHKATGQSRETELDLPATIAAIPPQT
jgi:hypothetical protein